MTRQRFTKHREPATAPAPAAVTPRADWSDWSADRERTRIAGDVEQERQRWIDRAIYPRELAERIGIDAARRSVPDWHRVRDDHRGAFVQLLRERPELQQKDVRSLDKLLTEIRMNLPDNRQTLIADLRAVLEPRILAHEAAAYFVGVETGRALERQHTDGKGIIRTHPRRPTADGSLRIHFAQD